MRISFKIDVGSSLVLLYNALTIQHPFEICWEAISEDSSLQVVEGSSVCL